MKPIEFPGQSIIFAKDQPQYQPLPALVFTNALGAKKCSFQPMMVDVNLDWQKDDPTGVVISCWELTDEEIENLVKSKRLYISQMTFCRGLSPILPATGLSDLVVIPEK